tara:strand:- start:1274 stop:3610 length:2337 start_codon:yes stop_codon:yes gene_type:complete
MLVGCDNDNNNNNEDEAQGVVQPVVADGYLRGATVFVDMDKNQLLDKASEPWGITGNQGVTEWEIKPTEEQLAEYPVIADVPVGAYDEDFIVIKADGSEDLNTAAIEKHYILSSPAGRPEFISPMTTLIHQDMVHSGASIEDAHTAMLASLGKSGTSLDLFSDYIESGDKVTHRIAQLVAKDFGQSIEDVEMVFNLDGSENSTVMSMVHQRVMVNLAEYSRLMLDQGPDEIDPQSYEVQGMRGMDSNYMTQVMGQISWLQNCAGCHGANNEGLPGDGPALTASSDFTLLGSGSMRKVSVNDTQLDALKAWLPAGKPAAWTESCASCHGTENQGVDGDGAPLFSTFELANVRDGISKTNDDGVTTIPMPAFATGTISDAELDEIRAWLPVGTPAVWTDFLYEDPSGYDNPFDKENGLWACKDCHGANNEGLPGDGPRLTAASNFNRIGQGQMTGITLTEVEIAELKAWIPAGDAKSIWAERRFFDSNPKWSEKLYSCSGCHGDENQGKIGDAASVSIDSNFDMIPYGTMNGLTVTDAELVILKDWLRGLKQAKPAVWTGDVDKGVIGCAGCHGDENQGIDGDGPSLVANFNWDHVRNGKGSEMPAYSAEELSDAELASIVRWVPARPAAWEDNRYKSQNVGSWNPESPEGLWSCGACHEGGHGGQLTNDADYSRVGNENMSGISVTAKEISDIQRWIANIPVADAPVGGADAPVDGAALFINKCGSCHTGNGLGSGSYGPSLTGVTFDVLSPTITDGPHVGGTSFDLTTEQIQAIADAL